VIRAQIRVEKVYKEVEKAGCVASAVIAERLRIDRNKLLYALRKLRQEGRVEAVSLGKTFLWCASRKAAEEVLAELTEALKKLLCGRYATPQKALDLIRADPEARRLFSRHIPLRRNPATIQLIDVLMRVFGEPIKTSRGRVYHIQRVHTDNTPTGISS
jgi:DNA-binding transcriptional regulator YhcF (GntR family)